MMKITDADYRSHALPCYPFPGEAKDDLIHELEQRVVLAVSEQDYYSNSPLQLEDACLPPRLYSPSDARKVA